MQEEHSASKDTIIKNVWLENFEDELPVISELLERYPYVAMDTEFPGVIYEEAPEIFRNSDQRDYMKVKINVDAMKVIQIGITLMDENGKTPEPVCTWQFNFDYDLDTELNARTSIIMLKESGIDFNKLKRKGISPNMFAEKVTQSGLVLNDRVHWICFHGSYDFAYYLKIMMNDFLPNSREKFFEYIRLFFPNVYDLKTIVPMFHPMLDGSGLTRIADMLGIDRVGITHQAGSDSFVTAKIFFNLKENSP